MGIKPLLTTSSTTTDSPMGCINAFGSIHLSLFLSASLALLIHRAVTRSNRLINTAFIIKIQLSPPVLRNVPCLESRTTSQKKIGGSSGGGFPATGQASKSTGISPSRSFDLGSMLIKRASAHLLGYPTDHVH